MWPACISTLGVVTLADYSTPAYHVNLVRANKMNLKVSMPKARGALLKPRRLPCCVRAGEHGHWFDGIAGLASSGPVLGLTPSSLHVWCYWPCALERVCVLRGGLRSLGCRSAKLKRHASTRKCPTRGHTRANTSRSVQQGIRTAASDGYGGRALFRSLTVSWTLRHPSPRAYSNPLHLNLSQKPREYR